VPPRSARRRCEVQRLDPRLVPRRPSKPLQPRSNALQRIRFSVVQMLIVSEFAHYPRKRPGMNRANLLGPQIELPPNRQQLLDLRICHLQVRKGNLQCIPIVSHGVARRLCASRGREILLPHRPASFSRSAAVSTRWRIEAGAIRARSKEGTPAVIRRHKTENTTRRGECALRPARRCTSASCATLPEPPDDPISDLRLLTSYFRLATL
jgi:hypothetical protein